MTALLDIIPGGGLAAIGALIVAILGAVGLIYNRGSSAGKAAQKAKEADAYERHLQDIAAAGRARDGALKLPDDDPYNRDNRKA